MADLSSDPNDIFVAAVATLRRGLPALEEVDELRSIRDGRDEVLARFNPLFSADGVATLTAEEFGPFLDFKVNRHWSGIHRQRSKLTAGDMGPLRAALGVLLDESRLLAERYDAARAAMPGLGKATATPILLVAYPDKYGVWNSKSEDGLRRLGLFPRFTNRESEGQQYAAVNAVLTRLARELGIDFWTLDTLWEWFDMTAQRLAPPFDSIFADRAQAEWAFDLFADAAKWLSDSPDDPRLALTLPLSKLMRLNFGNSMVLDFGNHGRDVHLTALIEDIERIYDFDRTDAFRVTVKGTDKQFAVYTLSPELVRECPSELRTIFERSMREFGKEFESWKHSNLRRSHVPELFEGLFNKGKRDRLLTQGLTIPPEKLVIDPNQPTIANEFHGFTHNAFDFLHELRANNNKEWMEDNRDRWRDSVLEPMRALFADLGPHVKAKFDPFIAPEEFEIRPTAHRVLARINKNWTATADSKYHEYFWGAFYRTSLKRQTDAQLFITMFADQFRFGFFVGRGAASIRDRFRERVLTDPHEFYELTEALGLSDSTQYGWSFESGQRKQVDVDSADDLTAWVESGDYDLLRVLPPEKVISLGPALADHIFETFRRVFPIYLWAVADDYQALVERYLEVEFGPGPDVIEPPPALPYTFHDFLVDTELLPADAGEMLDLLHEKRQVIFYGPPGTGKTYVARHLGRLLTELAEPPPERLAIVQFHPAYGYEEFIEGIRPKRIDGGAAIEYPVVPGAFVRFCREAARIGGPCVFIIDEINRGNIPRIFGELMLLLEYRDLDVLLPYSGTRFRIPRNVYLIGTMNTADRSIALVDFALRRRFHFFQFAADPDLLDRWLVSHPTNVPYLAALYRRLTNEAIDDPAFRIGPSYFMKADMDESALARIWRRSVMPYLREYYFDQPANADQWSWDGDLVRDIRGNARG